MECSLHHNFHRTLIFTLSLIWTRLMSFHLQSFFFRDIGPALSVLSAHSVRVRADERLRSRARFLSLSLSILIFCPNYCLLKGEHYYLTYYGLWLICFMRFMSANNTLNCFMFLVRSIDRWLLCRTNDTKKTSAYTQSADAVCCWAMVAGCLFSLSLRVYHSGWPAITW